MIVADGLTLPPGRRPATGHLVLREGPARLTADIDTFPAGLSDGGREGRRTGS